MEVQQTPEQFDIDLSCFRNQNGIGDHPPERDEIGLHRSIVVLKHEMEQQQGAELHMADDVIEGLQELPFPRRRG